MKGMDISQQFQSKIISFLVLCLLPLMLWSQDGETFVVIKVKGEIYNKTVGEKLTAGSTVKHSDQLEFTPMHSEAIAISDSRGKFVIKIPQADLFGSPGDIASVSHSASPISSRSQYSVRSLDPRIDDFADYLGNETFYVIGDGIELKFSEYEYKLSEQQFFSVVYLSDGQEHSVDLHANNQSIMFERNQVFNFFSSTGVYNDVKFYYLNASKGVIKHLTTIDVAFVSKEELNKEFSVLIKVLTESGMERKAIRSYVKQYFLDVYGKTDPGALSVYVSELMN